MTRQSNRAHDIVFACLLLGCLCTPARADDDALQCRGATGLADDHAELLDVTGWLSFVRRFVGVVDYVPELDSGRSMAISCATYVGTDEFASDCALEIATNGRGSAEIAADIVFGADTFSRVCRGSERPASAQFESDLVVFCSGNPDDERCTSACERPDLEPARMLAAINEVRARGARCGDRDMPPVGPLAWNGVLATVAAGHAEDMAQQNYFAHEGLDGRNGCERVLDGGYAYRGCGENLAFGQDSVQDALDGWLASPGHCRSLLSDRFEDTGAAVAVDVASRCSTRWVQTFGTPLD